MVIIVIVVIIVIIVNIIKINNNSNNSNISNNCNNSYNNDNNNCNSTSNVNKNNNKIHKSPTNITYLCDHPMCSIYMVSSLPIYCVHPTHTKVYYLHIGFIAYLTHCIACPHT